MHNFRYYKTFVIQVVKHPFKKHICTYVMRFYFQFLTTQTIAKHLRLSVKNTEDSKEDFLKNYACLEKGEW